MQEGLLARMPLNLTLYERKTDAGMQWGECRGRKARQDGLLDGRRLFAVKETQEMLLTLVGRQVCSKRVGSVKMLAFFKRATRAFGIEREIQARDSDHGQYDQTPFISFERK